MKTSAFVMHLILSVSLIPEAISLVSKFKNFSKRVGDFL